MMNACLTEDAKAIILLCGALGKERPEKPLSLTEYSSLVRWLMAAGMRPGDLLRQEYISEASIGAGLDGRRLKFLLGRGVQLGFAVEEWQSNGIWIASRSDADYPARYKKRLGDKAPPLLYGAGERALLAGGGLAVAGAPEIDIEGEDFARYAAELCSHNNMPVVSGGAQGVEQAAINAALGANGAAIEVLAGNLLKKSLARDVRHALAERKLLLLSPCPPEANFTAREAMSNNKLIYALADYGLVVSAEHKKGITWAGAEEELKREKHMPIFVRTGKNAPPGNLKLPNLGAIPWPELAGKDNLKPLLSDLSAGADKKLRRNNLLDFQKEL